MEKKIMVGWMSALICLGAKKALSLMALKAQMGVIMVAHVGVKFTAAKAQMGLMVVALLKAQIGLIVTLTQTIIRQVATQKKVQQA